MKAIVDFQFILSNIQYKNWKINVFSDADRVYLQVSFISSCSKTGKSELQKGRKWLLSPFMTKSEVVATAFKACLTAEEHECRENFLYKNSLIFGPHFDVDRLVDLCDNKALDERKHATN